ncbi:MAG: hypothetical protein WBE72_14670 [Terracidiphilus sp.]
MSPDQQSESKAWWQTMPGLLTAAAAILTAFTGLLVALNQIGLFHHAQPPAPAQSSASGAAPGSASGPTPASNPQGAANPAAVSLTLPANASVRTEHAVYTLLSARVTPYSPGEVALDFTVRMTNRDNFDANFWAASFRLAANGALETPSNDLDELVPAHSTKEGQIEFVIPANTSTVGLQMGNVGEGKPAIAIALHNP